MADLTWMEREIAIELAGALASTASLCAHRPEVAADIRAAVARRLDPAERDLIRALHVEIEHQAEEARNVDA